MLSSFIDGMYDVGVSNRASVVQGAVVETIVAVTCSGLGAAGRGVVEPAFAYLS